MKVIHFYFRDCSPLFIRQICDYLVRVKTISLVIFIFIFNVNLICADERNYLNSLIISAQNSSLSNNSEAHKNRSLKLYFDKYNTSINMSEIHRYGFKDSNFQNNTKVVDIEKSFHHLWFQYSIRSDDCKKTFAKNCKGSFFAFVDLR